MLGAQLPTSTCHAARSNRMDAHQTAMRMRASVGQRRTCRPSRGALLRIGGGGRSSGYCRGGMSAPRPPRGGGAPRSPLSLCVAPSQVGLAY